MKKTLLTILLNLVYSTINSQTLSIGVRTGVSNWINTDLYTSTVSNPVIGDLYSKDYQIIVLYKTDKLFAVEAGHTYFQRHYNELIRQTVREITSRNLEMHYSPMWRVVKVRNFISYMGIEFSLITDFTSEQFSIIDDLGQTRNSNNSYTDSKFFVGINNTISYRILSHLDVQSRLTYKLDTEKMWGDKSPYSNSKISFLIGTSYTF